jgi:hypothetical protein
VQEHDALTTQGAPEIDDFLSRAALRGERSVASLRISLCALGLVNNLFFAGGLAPFLAGDAVALVRVGTMAMGIVFSVAMIRRLRKGGEAGWLLGVSAGAGDPHEVRWRLGRAAVPAKGGVQGRARRGGRQRGRGGRAKNSCGGGSNTSKKFAALF